MDKFNRQPRYAGTGTNPRSEFDFETTRCQRQSRARTRKPPSSLNSYEDSTSARLHKDPSSSSSPNSRSTALHRAIKTNDANLLLSILSTTHLSTQYKTHLLHLSISHGRKELMVVLLDHGADINGLDRNGTAPLEAAISVEGSRESIAVLLIERGADLTQDSPLHWAARRDWAAAVSALCRRGVDVDQPSSTIPLSLGEEEKRKRGITPLHIATYYSSLHAARSLLHHGASPSLSSQSAELALAEAISNAYIPMVDLLLTSGISLSSAIDAQGGTPLMAAVCLDDVGLVRCLLHHGAGATMGARDGQGEDVLFVAVKWAGKEVLEMLLDHGVAKSGVNARNSRGQTPLGIAIGRGDVGVVEPLLRAGARRDGGVERALNRVVRDAGGMFDFAVVDLLNRHSHPAGRGRDRDGVRNGSASQRLVVEDEDDDEWSTIGQETDPPRRGEDPLDRRVARYTRKPGPDFLHPSARDVSPSLSSADGFPDPFPSDSERRPSLDRRLVRWNDMYEHPGPGWDEKWGGGLFGEDWGEGFDEGFGSGDERGSGRSEVGFGRGRGRARGRGRVTKVISFTVRS